MSDGIEPYMSPFSTTRVVAFEEEDLGVGTADICMHYRLAQDVQQPTLLSALPLHSSPYINIDDAEDQESSTPFGNQDQPFILPQPKTVEDPTYVPGA